jgi:hypothetical protein
VIDIALLVLVLGAVIVALIFDVVLVAMRLQNDDDDEEPGPVEPPGPEEMEDA